MGNRWPGIQDWIDASKKHVDVLPADPDLRRAIRQSGEIRHNSMLGTVLNNCGGMIVEHWIRIYGAGALDFSARNAAFGLENSVVADDVLGGLFGGMEDGTIGYFAPATLVWEPLHLSYPQFLQWCLSGDTQMFYELQRWKGWESDAETLSFDRGFAFTPELWRLGSDVGERAREIVPIVELVRGLLQASEERRKKYGISNGRNT